MKIIKISDLKGTGREVVCPKGGFTSNRILLESDNMGYTLTKTVIPAGEEQHWHYKNHLETCYCISGRGVLRWTEKQRDAITMCEKVIEPDVIYALDKHESHYFQATEETVLICVFNPPLTGSEVHQEDGSYVSIASI